MGPTVLVLEGEPKLSDLIRSFLDRERLVVLSMGSGARAVALATSSSPDLVVLDLGLDDQDRQVRRVLEEAARHDVVAAVSADLAPDLIAA